MLKSRNDGNLFLGENLAWATPITSVATPTVNAIGSVRVVGLDFVQDFNFPTPPTGWFWRIGLLNGPFHPISSVGQTTVTLAPTGATRTPASAFLYNLEGDVTSPIIIPLTYPNPIVSPPTLIGSIPNVEAVVGDTVTRNAATAISGQGIMWSILVNGLVPTSGWSISSAGVITIPTTAAYSSTIVTVIATNSSGSVNTVFTATV